MINIIHISSTILDNGNILECKSTRIGHSVSTHIIFSLYRINWYGDCDPTKEGYKPLFGNIYIKKNLVI